MRTGSVSNKHIKNIAKQNLEVLSVLKQNNLSYKWHVFILHKILSPLKQYIQKPINKMI